MEENNTLIFSVCKWIYIRGPNTTPMHALWVTRFRVHIHCTLYNVKTSQAAQYKLVKFIFISFSKCHWRTYFFLNSNFICINQQPIDYSYLYIHVRYTCFWDSTCLTKRIILVDIHVCHPINLSFHTLDFQLICHV